MKNKEYEKQLRRLHGELVNPQEWVKDSGAKICILFEGRDTAGKGGVIKAITFGFCTAEQLRTFFTLAPLVEKAMVNSGIILIKYWLEVGPDQQMERLTSRIDDPRKTWKLSEMDLASYKKWDKYTKARDDMLTFTDSEWAPWHTVNSNDKRSARLNVISHLLSQVPYVSKPRSEVRLPERTVTPDPDPSIVESRLIETRSKP